ncbi:MAG: long-chain-fatty-acid--CoA ligase [Pseudomonadota bacterium]
MQSLHYAVWPQGKPHTLRPSEQSVLENLRASVERYPERPAINYYGAPLTYADLLRQVDQLAGYLSHEVGIGPDDRVAICLQNCPQFVIAYYAILAANAVIVPINPMSRRSELQHVLQDAGARAVIFGEEVGSELAPIWEACGRPSLISARYRDYLDPDTDLPLPMIVRAAVEDGIGVPWADALAHGHPPPKHARGPSDQCIISYSSGSTGRPKGCLHTHASVNATIRAYPPWIDFEEGSRVLATLPFCHVTGMQHSMNLPLHMASTIFMMTRWSPELAARLIESERIEHWRSITTMMIDFLALAGIENVDLSSLKAIGGGGAQMPASVARKMSDLIGLDYIEAYGLTETMAPTHINPPAAPKTQCLGIPIFDVDSRIIDPETLLEIGPNQTGEIVTHAPQLFQEYWQSPDATNAAFIDIAGKRFFRTGDIGYYDAEGYFFFVDRLKRMINVSGLKVWPAEVEAILHSHCDVSEACVVGDPDPRAGEAVRAVIVLRPGRATLSADALSSWCKENMAAYKVPKRFEFRDALPRSGAGKVLWREL